MVFQIITKEPKEHHKLKFIVKDVDVSIMNSLRRIILSEIPCPAFYFDTYDQEVKHIVILKNTNVLHNEFMAHRISMIPLYFDKNDIINFETLKYTDYKFVINKKNTTNDVIHITTRDFEIYDEAGIKKPDSFREYIFPKNSITNDYILITKLRPNLYDNNKGEELHVECKASIGTGTKNARWTTVSQCAYFNTVDPILASEFLKLETANLSPAEKVKKEIKFDIIDQYFHFKKNKYDEPNEFEFTLQSECRLTPREIFTMALEILEKKIMNFKDTIDDLNISLVGNIQQIEIENQNHTLLNVLHAMIYNKCFRNPENPIEYIGYHETHPLKNMIYLKIKFTDQNITKQGIQDFMRHYCDEIINDIVDLKTKWSDL